MNCGQIKSKGARAVPRGRFWAMVAAMARSFLPVLGAALAVAWPLAASRAQDPARFGLNDAAGAVQVQLDGKLLVAGAFTRFNGAAVPGIIRLNADGTLDPTYKASDTIAPGSRLELKPNGKLLYYGLNPAVTDAAPRDVARLSVNGAIDPEFRLPTDLGNTSVGLVAAPAGGKSYLALYGGTGGYRLVRVNGDGSLDAAFGPVRVFFTDAGQSVAQPPLAVAPQADGKVLIGGGFNQVNDARRAGLARLNADGTLDAAYQVALTPPSALPTVGGVDAIYLLADGRAVIGGTFDAVNGTPQRNFARLHPDGTLDPTFIPDAAVTSASPTLLAVQPDGKPIFQLRLVSFSGQPVVRLNADGTRDPAFNVLVTGGRNSRTPSILDLQVQADGKLVAAGDFTGVNGDARNNLARLNADGTVDPGLIPGGNLPPLRTTINVTAVRASTVEGGAQPGVFLFSRAGGDTTLDVSVNYVVAGSAVPGVNYQPLPLNSVIIPAGRTEAKVRVIPYPDGARTGNLTVKVRLQPGGYGLGSEVKAKVFIVDVD